MGLEHIQFVRRSLDGLATALAALAEAEATHRRLPHGKAAADHCRADAFELLALAEEIARPFNFDTGVGARVRVIRAVIARGVDALPGPAA